MSIYEYDEERTMRQMCKEGFPQDRIVEKLEKKFQLSHETALEYFNNFAAQKD